MSVGLLTKRVHRVHDDYYIYKELAKEYQVSNDLIRRNTLHSVIKKLEWLRDEKDKLKSPTGGITQAIEIVKSMIKDL